MDLNILEVEEIIKGALMEDIGIGDITTNSIVPANATTKAFIYAKQPGVIAGLEVAKTTFKLLDSEIEFKALIQEGKAVTAGTILAEISGSARAILTGERVALNLLQRMSGIATRSNQIVSLIAGTKTSIADTRKTTPGLRILEKYAVRVGGGMNHRLGLYDAVLIKDNHIKVAGGIKEAVSLARKKAPHTMKIEVECENLEQVKEALEAKADIIMLDNMKATAIGEAVKIIANQALTEASGGINESNIKEVAQSGIDIISIGALTHSVTALDISLDVGEIKTSV